MTKTEILDYMKNLMQVLEEADRKTYVISTRLERLRLLLKAYNVTTQADALARKIEELEECNKSGGYDEKKLFKKDQYRKLINEICDIVESYN